MRLCHGLPAIALAAAGCAAAAVAAAACGDPSLEVSFSVPARYRDQVASISLEGLAPSETASESFGCDDLAFGDVSADAAAQVLVERAVVRGDRGGAALRGIPRTGAKLLVARGLDADEQPVVAACAEVGDVDETTSVALVGEPVALAVTAAGNVSDPLPAALSVQVTDVTGATLRGIPVRWTTLGAGGLLGDGSDVTGMDGRASVPPDPPDLPGPIGVDVQVRWQSSRVPRVLGFEQPAVAFSMTLPGAAPDRVAQTTDALYRVGRVGPEGELGLAALGPTTDEAVGRRVVVAYHRPSGWVSATSDPVIGVLALGLVRGGGRDRIVALSRFAWVEIAPDGDVANRVSPAAGKDARRIFAFDAPGDACAPEVGGAILVAFTDDTVGVFDGEANPIDSPLAAMAGGGRLLASGCAVALDGELHRTLVLARSDEQTLTIVAAIDRVRTGSWLVLPGGVGFAPPTAGEPGTLLGVELALDGLAVARSRLVTIGNAGLGTEPLDRIDVPAAALSTAVGDLDADGLLDVAALLNFPGDEGTEARAFIALGVSHLDERLVGLSAAIGGEGSRALVADFDGDGHGDVLLATPTAFTVFDSATRGGD